MYRNVPIYFLLLHEDKNKTLHFLLVHISENGIYVLFIFILFPRLCQIYTHRVLQTIQMKLIFLCVWAEPAVLGSAKTALQFKYEI